MKTSILANRFGLRLGAGLLFGILASALPSAARADATSEARVLFDAGANAYQAGSYKAAIAAFEQAYRIEARPGLLFSIAQAHRRQYLLDRRAGHIAVALKRFREYVVQVPEGGRHADALLAISELEPLAQQLERDGQLQPLEDFDVVSRLMVSCPAPGATIAVDDEKEGKPAPLIVELPGGKHKIRVWAKGFFEETREIETAQGQVTALDLPLREKPAQVTVQAPAGTEVFVDSLLVAKTPLAAPLEIAPGQHQIWMAQNGRSPQEETILVGRGEQRTLTATLPFTLQRKVAFGLGAGGALALGTGVAFGIVAAGAEAEAGRIRGQMEAGQVICRTDPCAELDSYNSAVRARDTARLMSGLTLGAGVLALGAGAALYFLDSPGAAPKTRETGPDRGTPIAPKPLEISVTPFVAPSAAGAVVVGRF